MICSVACAQVICTLPRVVAGLRARDYCLYGTGCEWQRVLRHHGPARERSHAGARARVGDFPSGGRTRTGRRNAKTLTDEGRLLLSRDQVSRRLRLLQHCGLGRRTRRFPRQCRSGLPGARAGAADRQRRPGRLSKRDLAIAYSYAGDLDDAERYAREALASSPKAPEQVFAPAHKVLGDIALRRGDPQAAIADYGQALDTASERYKPLVLLSVASAQIAAGDAASARKTLDAAGPPATGELASSYRRIEGNLLLAEGKPEEAKRVFGELLTQSGSGDANYDRLWAHEGIGRADLALGDKANARVAYLRAVDDSEKIRARFRSDEFKTGLFGDTQRVFEKAIELTAESGDYEPRGASRSAVARGRCSMSCATVSMRASTTSS